MVTKMFCFLTYFPKKTKNKSRLINGFSQLFLLLGMLLVAVSLPIATSLVQNSQENRSSATSSSSYSSTCLDDDSKCEGNSHYVCRYGVWELEENCPNGCDGDSCKATGQTCTSFEYSAWGACGSNGVQTRTVISSSPAGCTGGEAVTSQSCVYVNNATSATASDGDTKCVDGNVYRYFYDASGGESGWGLYRDCGGSGCSGGLCNNAECTGNTITCNNNVLKYCSNGKWITTTCQYACATSGTACNTAKTELTPGVDLTKYHEEIIQLIEKYGYGTREAAAAVALYLAEDFPYKIIYHGMGGTTNDAYQLINGFLSKYDGTYNSRFGGKAREVNEGDDDVVLKDDSNRTIEGLSCMGLVEWVYRTIGYDAGLKGSKQNINTNTVEVDGEKVVKSEWLDKYTPKEDIDNTLEVGDLVYTIRDSNGSMHVAIVVEIDRNIDTVKIVQSSATDGVSTEYIDMFTLEPKEGGTVTKASSFSFYSSLDGYYKAYNEDIIKSLYERLSGESRIKLNES